MKRILKLIIITLLLGLLLVFAVFFSPYPEYVVRKVSNFIEIKTCRAKGGEVVSSNELGWGIIHYANNVCAFRQPDADKVCSDSSQCQGVCVIPFDKPYDNNTTGKCQRYKNMGVNCIVEKTNGKTVTHSCPTE